MVLNLSVVVVQPKVGGLVVGVGKDFIGILDWVDDIVVAVSGMSTEVDNL
jgi:hypothetical protein